MKTRTRRRDTAWKKTLGGVALLLCVVSASASAGQLDGIDVSSQGQTTTVRFSLSAMPSFHYFSLPDPARAVIDFSDTEAGQIAPVGHQGAVDGVRLAQHADGKLRAVIDLSGSAHLDDVHAEGKTLVARISGASNTGGSASSAVATKADESASGTKAAADTDEPQALYRTGKASGPIVVVIDPGHGGHDSGTRAASGLKEKTVVLSIGKALAAKLKRTPDIHPVLTRDSDHYLTLRRRVEIAQEHHANLFVSIHANAYPDDKSVDGATCYMLSENGATDAKAAQLAHFENTRDRSLAGVKFSGDPTLNAVLTDLFQNASINDANNVAQDIIQQFSHVGPIYRHKPPRANFAVLRDPMIPSVLCEVAFLSNPGQARELSSDRFRDQLADAMYKGITRYFKAHPPEQIKATAGTLYTVKSGDTLSGIAARQGVSEAALMDINHLHSKRLHAGQKLQLPNGS
ncbi:N-acetylmuramoyl-L-alanine amidase [Salinisphaera sp. Q1T1-3]|uniref:N-acetylmuramoyl-L-alanine amidase n=1 Tax=Salinisphaera sp. Q1T1-3 TaxID=2321229 RepID=UPI000E7497EF|nr:N-acetylmuramoyl-L-alanine amidase [Salinisphaera sp. Q1T1-3]RJS93366.1 LysM peptidoglycan-binding domain-containing protein [Salinisphaera sp. Q1T1-3]